MDDEVYSILKEIKKYYYIIRKDFVVDGCENFIFFSSIGNLISCNSFYSTMKTFIGEFNLTAQN